MSWLSNQTRNSGFLSKTFFLLFIGFLPTQLGKHFWPQESFVLGIRIDYLAPTLYVTDILLVCFLTVFLYEYRAAVIRQVLLLVSRPVFSLAALFFVLSILSSLFQAERPLLVLYGFLKVSEISALVLCTWILLSEKPFRLSVLMAFSLGMVFESALSIVQFLTQSSLGGVFYYVGERTFSQVTPGIALSEIGGTLLLRPYGTLPHPNVLAGYLLLGSALLLYAKKQTTQLWQRMWFSAVILLSFFVVLLSLSRLSIVLFLGMLFAFYVSYKKKGNKAVGISLLIVISMVLVLAPFLSERYTSLTFGSASVQERLFLLRASVSMIHENPFIGVGLNHFLVSLPEFITHGTSIFLLQPVHNVFMLILSEGGVLMFLSFFLVIGSVSKHILRSARDTRVTVFVLVGLVVAIGMVDHYLLTLQQGQLLLGFVLGFVLSIASENPKQKRSVSP